MYLKPFTITFKWSNWLFWGIQFSPNKIVSKFSYHSEWNHGTRSENLLNFFIQVENMKILSNNTGKILILEFIFLDVHRNLNISTPVSINHLRYPLFNNHDFDWFLCPSIFFSKWTYPINSLSLTVDTMDLLVWWGHDVV